MLFVHAVTSALCADLIGSVRSSREARRALTREPSTLVWIEVTEADRAAAAPFAPLFECEAADASTDRAEFHSLFEPARLNPAHREMPHAAAVALCRALDLGEHDGLIDLGSSRGGLILAAAATTPVARAGGVELSPRRDAAARAARQRLAEVRPAAARASFVSGDLRETPSLVADFAEHNVIFCAIQGDTHRRPEVVHDFLRAASSHNARAGVVPTRRRLLLAGFGLDVQGTALESRVKFVRAYAIAAEPGDAAQGPVAMPLYNDEQGPRLILEYALEM